jgi:hypothetical protein
MEAWQRRLTVDLNHGGRRERRGGTEESHSGLTGAIIGSGIKVHSQPGPGLLEPVYEECLCHELTKADHGVRRQVECPGYRPEDSLTEFLCATSVFSVPSVVNPNVYASRRLLP